jgi:hypothetical protein
MVPPIRWLVGIDPRADHASLAPAALATFAPGGPAPSIRRTPRYQSLPVIYQLNVKNLFDNVYDPSAVSQFVVAMGDARRVSLSATVKF